MTEAHSLPTLSEMVAAQAGPAAKAAEAGWVRPYQPPSVAQAGAVVTEVGHESPVELGPPLYQKIGVAPLALAGASLAALGTGIVFGTKALHHKNRADQGKPDWRSQVRQGKNDQLAANASFAIAAALALAGFGVWLSSDDVPAAGLSAVPSGSSSVLMLHLARPF